MSKIWGKVKQTLFGTSIQTLVFAVIAISLVVLMAFFAGAVPFHEFDMTAHAYQMVVEQSSERHPDHAPLSFTYRGNTIVLTRCISVNEDAEIEVFATSRFGTVRLSEANMANLSPYLLGSFVAVYPVQVVPIEGQLIPRRISASVKTDLRTVQSNTALTPMLSDSRVMLEIGMSNARRIFAYYGGIPLANMNIYVTFANGRREARTTDAYGYIPNVSIREIRRGVSVEYSPNYINTFIQTYMPQNARIISPAIVPLLTLTLMTAIAIVGCVFFRKMYEKRNLPASYTDVKGKRGKVKLRRAPAFVIVRWVVMIASFVLLIWGGRLLGVWFEEITIPVFACGRNNEEQLVGSVCYYMSSLNVLFTLPWQTIAMFFGGLIVPLVLFGRLLCGFVCPMGLVQDTLHVTRQATRTKGISLTDKLYARLSLIKWTFVLLFLGMAFVALDFCMICPVGVFSPALAGFKFSIFIGGFIALFVLVGSFFKQRFFCLICPLGVIMGLFHKISLVRLKKDVTACTECGACYEACPMGIKIIYTEREKTDVTTINCIMCGECVRHCPETNALAITLCGKKIYNADREKFMKANAQATPKSGKKHADCKGGGCGKCK
ncbi:MAG: 4Fe-4S dicluster domain-containing protein [Oscillospiraceae bacterium]|nr:4Fe-4S dicluster domain-containing protein [Oscillospiraceae bacterium]